MSGGHHRFRCDQPLQAPTRHAEVLGKAVDADDAVIHHQRRFAVCAVETQPQVKFVQESDSPLDWTKLWMRRSSSGWMDVPVGLEGDASSTPRVLSFQPPCRLWRQQRFDTTHTYIGNSEVSLIFCMGISVLTFCTPLIRTKCSP